MLNIYKNGTIESLTSLAFCTDFIRESDFKRSRYNPVSKTMFDVYVTLLYLGFFEEEQHSFSSLLEKIPKEYLPCDAEQKDSFSVTSATLSRIVKQFSPFVSSNIKASVADVKSFKELESLLPMTLDQANAFLIEKKVCSSPIAARAIELLVELFVGEGRVSSVLVYKTAPERNKDGERSERYTTPSFRVLTLTEKIRDTSNLSSAIVRSCEWLGRNIGIVDFRLVDDLLVPFNRDLTKSLGDNRTALSDFCLSVCRLKYDLKDAYFTVDGDIGESYLYTTLWKYLDIFSAIDTSQFPIFISRILKYKARGKKPISRSKSHRLSAASVLKFWDDEYLTHDHVLMLVQAIDYLSLAGSTCTLDRRVYVEFEPDDSIALSALSDYFETNGRFECGVSDSEKASILLKELANKMRSKMLNALEEPCGFFEKIDNSFFVSHENTEKRNDHSGAYILPDYGLISDELFSENNTYDEEVTELGSRFMVYMNALRAKWFSSSRPSDLLVPRDNDRYHEYIKDRKELLLTTDFRKCLSWVKIEIKYANDMLDSMRAYLRYLKVQNPKTDNSTSISQTELRIRKWEGILLVLNDELEVIYSGEPYKVHVAHLKRVEELSKSRSALAIKPNQYKAYIALHDFIHEFLNSAGSHDVEMVFAVEEFAKKSSETFDSEVVSMAVLKDFIDVYCNNLSGDFSRSSSKKALSNYNNMKTMLLACITLHPYAID